MKKTNLFMLIVPAIFVAMIVITASCTKEGPQGPAGADGADGENGVQTCGQCHNFTEFVLARTIQYNASGHLNGGTYERNSSSCAPCHTSMGYREVIESGAQETAETIANPTPVNCYTCHLIHDTYTTDDWALRVTEPVTWWIDGGTSDQGTANVCLDCHQSRVPNPMIDPTNPTQEVEVTSFRYGPHHGPQGQMVAGTGAYEIGSGYSNSAHSNIENTCVACHMAEAYGDQAGGHTWNMSYEYHGHDEVNTAGCVECHTDPDALAEGIEETAAEIEELLMELGAILIDQGVMDTTYYAVPGTMTMNQAGAIFNFKFVEEDRSGGMHNKNYAKTLLENSIESLQ